MNKEFLSKMVADFPILSSYPVMRENRDDESVISVSDSVDTSFSTKKKGTSECSHKVIEKRRRDRINSCLSELAHLIPTAQNGKQGSGKLEKAEILELTVEFIKTLQASKESTSQDTGNNRSTGKHNNEKDSSSHHKPVSNIAELRKYWMGYSDCTAEVLRFLVAVEAMDPQQPCFQRLMAHLRHRHNLMVEYKENGNSQALRGNHPGFKKTNEKHDAKGKKSKKSHSHKSGEDNSASPSKKARLEVDNKNGIKEHEAKLAFIDSCLEEEDKKSNGNGSISGSSSSNENGSSNGNGSSDNGNGNGIGCERSSAGSMQFGNVLAESNMQFRNQFVPQPYSMPTYALHPAGTHYVPVAVHPGIPMNPFANLGGMPGANMMSQGMGMSMGANLGGLQGANMMPSGMGMGPYFGSQVPIFPPSPPMSGIFQSGAQNIPQFPGTRGKLSRGRTQAGRCKDCKVDQSQESNGGSENESNSSGDESSFTSRSSGNTMSEIGVQTECPMTAYSASFSPSSR